MAMVDTFTNKLGLEQEVLDLKGLALVAVSQHIISLERDLLNPNHTTVTV